MTHETIINITRSNLRYALFRVRSGNPDDSHNEIYNYFKPRLNNYKLEIKDFSEEWDLDKVDPRNIISGHVVRLHNEELKSLTIETEKGEIVILNSFENKVEKPKLEHKSTIKKNRR